MAISGESASQPASAGVSEVALSLIGYHQTRPPSRGMPYRGECGLSGTTVCVPSAGSEERCALGCYARFACRSHCGLRSWRLPSAPVPRRCCAKQRSPRRHAWTQPASCTGAGRGNTRQHGRPLRNHSWIRRWNEVRRLQQRGPDLSQHWRRLPKLPRVTVVIWRENRARFGRPEARYLNKTICVRGYVGTYAGVPDIEASSPSQIAIAR